MQGRHLMVLRMLPIFETAAASLGQDPPFVNLDGVTSMAPEGTDAALLSGSGLVVCGSTYEAKVLEEKLGILQLSLHELMRDHLLPR